MKGLLGNGRYTYTSDKDNWNSAWRHIPDTSLFPGMLVYLARPGAYQSKPLKVLVASYTYYRYNIAHVWGYRDGSTEISECTFSRAYLI